MRARCRPSLRRSPPTTSASTFFDRARRKSMPNHPLRTDLPPRKIRSRIDIFSLPPSLLPCLDGVVRRSRDTLATRESRLRSLKERKRIRRSARERERGKERREGGGGRVLRAAKRVGTRAHTSSRVYGGRGRTGVRFANARVGSFT